MGLPLTLTARDEMTLGERLRIAIDDMPKVGARRGIRHFQKLLAENYAGVVGTSYPAVHAYLKDKREPSRGFLEAAAELTGVHLEWLATGEGPRSAKHEEVESASRAAMPARPPELGARLMYSVFDAMSIGDRPMPGVGVAGRGPLPESVPYWTGPLAEIWLRLAVQHSDSAEAERTIAAAIAAPLKAFGIDAEKMHHAAIGRFITAMLPALFVATDERLRQSFMERNPAHAEDF